MFLSVFITIYLQWHFFFIAFETLSVTDVKTNLEFFRGANDFERFSSDSIFRSLPAIDCTFHMGRNQKYSREKWLCFSWCRESKFPQNFVDILSTGRNHHKNKALFGIKCACCCCLYYMCTCVFFSSTWRNILRIRSHHWTQRQQCWIFRPWALNPIENIHVV